MLKFVRQRRFAVWGIPILSLENQLEEDVRERDNILHILGPLCSDSTCAVVSETVPTLRIEEFFTCHWGKGIFFSFTAVQES